MAVGTGAGFTYRLENVDATVKALSQSARDIRLPASREMRAAARIIGKDHIVPALPGFAADAPAPQAPKLADTARAINDRRPVVKVGYVNPKLSGFKRTTVGRRKTARGSLAWGTEMGPNGGRGPGKPGWKAPGAPVNHYGGASRTSRGYWVTRAMESAAVLRPVLREYQLATERIFKKYGLT